MRLLTKFTLATSALVLGVMLLFALVNLGALRDLWLREAVKDVDNLSETLIRTTYHQMLDGDQRRVFAMIDEVGAQAGIEHIRLINKDGLIAFSTERSETGTFMAKDAAACAICHSFETPLTQVSPLSRSRLLRGTDGIESLGLAKAIYNQPACYNASCHIHSADDRLLGVLDVTVSLAELRKSMAQYRDTLIFFTILLLLLLFGCLSYLNRQFISLPVTGLLLQTRRLASGDLEGALETRRGDELGELAAAFNDMTVNLRQAHDQLQNWAATLERRVVERTQEIEVMQRQLAHSEKMASLGELVAGIAHEVNNPLTGILVFSNLVLEDARLDPQLRPDMATVVAETQRCAGIVRGLLDFSRQRAPQARLEDLNVLLDATLGLVEHQELFQNIRVERQYDDALPQIRIDPAQLSQVFMNLFINAAQAMPAGGVLTAATGWHPAADRLYITISDTGCGILEEHLGRVFDPFFSTKPHQGTGLGLSVSYGLIRSHGGEIAVRSQVGVGSTFTILLPLRDAEGEVRLADQAFTTADPLFLQ